MAPLPKRRKVEPVAEVTFDPAARQDYLTGYHKRKVQRAKHAKEIAAKKDKEEKLKDRRELRQHRKQETEQRVEQANAMMRANLDLEDEDEDMGTQSGDDEAEGEVWEGFKDIPVVNALDEYVDEDKYTTVVVKELDDIRDYESNDDEEEEEDAAGDKPANGAGEAEAKSKKPWAKRRPGNDKSKAKKKKRDFRYESKLERKEGRRKQKMKSSAAAKTRKGK